MGSYPDRHHPVFFLQDSLQALGADAVFNGRDDRTLGCWGLIVNGKPMVWLIDNRHEHERVKEDPAAAELLQRGALVCCAQKPDAFRIGGKWLALAVTPGYREPERPVEKLYDVAMVGYVRDFARAQMLSHVARHFKLYTGGDIFGDAAVSVYWQARVGLNVPTLYGAPDSYDINMRVPEILATGTALVTNYLPELDLMGIKDEGTHCITYRDADEMLAVIRYVIDHPEEAQEMGMRAAKEVREKHAYSHRAQTVLEWLA